MKLIATTRYKIVSLEELQRICNEYPNKTPNADAQKSFCHLLMNWIEVSLDVSFSDVQSILEDCQRITNGESPSPEIEWGRITGFVNILFCYLPTARKDDDWPSCKGLLEVSDFIKDDKIKQEIRMVIKMDETKDVITVGTLASFYLELAKSITTELLLYPIDIYGNKRRLMVKISQELNYCHLALIKTGEKITMGKMKEIEETQRKCEEMSKAYPFEELKTSVTYSIIKN